jgi:hypothetical protein
MSDIKKKLGTPLTDLFPNGMYVCGNTVLSPEDVGVHFGSPPNLPYIVDDGYPHCGQCGELVRGVDEQIEHMRGHVDENHRTFVWEFKEDSHDIEITEITRQDACCEKCHSNVVPLFEGRLSGLHDRGTEGEV